MALLTAADSMHGLAHPGTASADFWHGETESHARGAAAAAMAARPKMHREEALMVDELSGRRAECDVSVARPEAVNMLSTLLVASKLGTTFWIAARRGGERGPGGGRPFKKQLASS